MAYASDIRAVRGSIVATLGSAVLNGTENFKRYRTYRTTMSELQSLSNRELNDLGLSRSGIQRVALESAYGV